MKKVFYLVAVAVVSMAITSCGESSEKETLMNNIEAGIDEAGDKISEEAGKLVEEGKATTEEVQEIVEDKVDGMVESTTETLEETATDMKDAAVEKGTEMKKEMMK